MGSLSMPATSLHTKYHWPPARCSDLLAAGEHILALGGCFDDSRSMGSATRFDDPYAIEMGRSYEANVQV